MVIFPPFSRCVACGYSLKGLPPAHRCPECGWEYDNRMVIIKPLRPLRRAVLGTLAVAGVMYLTSPCVVNLFGALLGWQNAGWGYVFGVVVLLCIGVWKVLSSLYRGNRIGLSSNGISITRRSRTQTMEWNKVHRIAASDSPPWLQRAGDPEPISLAGLFDNLADQKILTRISEYGRTGRWDELFADGQRGEDRVPLVELAEIAASAEPLPAVRRARFWGWSLIGIGVPASSLTGVYYSGELAMGMFMFTFYAGLGLVLLSIWKGDRRLK